MPVTHVPDYESGGRAFESLRVHHFFKTLALHHLIAHAASESWYDSSTIWAVRFEAEPVGAHLFVAFR